MVNLDIDNKSNEKNNKFMYSKIYINTNKIYENLYKATKQTILCGKRHTEKNFYLFKCYEK